MTENLIPIAFFALVYAIVFLFVRKKERQMMIDKGVDPAIFMKEKPTSSSLKWGMFMIFIAMGVLVGEILGETTTLDEEASFFSMVFIFGGASLVMYYFLAKKEKSQNNDEHKST